MNLDIINIIVDLLKKYPELTIISTCVLINVITPHIFVFHQKLYEKSFSMFTVPFDWCFAPKEVPRDIISFNTFILRVIDDRLCMYPEDRIRYYFDNYVYTHSNQIEKYRYMKRIFQYCEKNNSYHKFLSVDKDFINFFLNTDIRQFRGYTGKFLPAYQELNGYHLYNYFYINNKIINAFYIRNLSEWKLFWYKWKGFIYEAEFLNYKLDNVIAYSKLLFIFIVFWIFLYLFNIYFRTCITFLKLYQNYLNNIKNKNNIIMFFNQMSFIHMKRLFSILLGFSFFYWLFR